MSPSQGTKGDEEIPKEISNGRTHGSRTPKKTWVSFGSSNLLGSVGIRSHSSFGGLQGTSPYFLKTSRALFEMKKSSSRLVWYVIVSWWNSFLEKKLVGKVEEIKSIMLQELNENSLATRILDSSSDPQPLKSLSHQWFFNTKNTVLKHINFIFHEKEHPKGVRWPFVVKSSERLVVKYLLEHLRLMWSSALHCSPDDWEILLMFRKSCSWGWYFSKTFMHPKVG